MAGAGTLLDLITAKAIQKRTVSAGNIVWITAGLLLSLVISYAVIFRCSWNMDYLGTPKDQIFLTSFTEDINKDREAGIVDKDHTTLLNIGCLDSGLYTTTGIYRIYFTLKRRLCKVKNHIFHEKFKNIFYKNKNGSFSRPVELLFN